MKEIFTLAEGATHKDTSFQLSIEKKGEMSNKKQSFGFTLAEVLITLGIIGVVAAITMPTLIQNYKKQVYVNQLKKTVSMLEQGFQKMLADEGVDNLSDLPYWPQNTIETNLSESNTKSFVDNVLANSFNVKYNRANDYAPFLAKAMNDGNDKNYEDGYNNHMQFADNSAIVFGRIRPDSGCEFIIDVNGAKGPNQGGRDIFELQMSNNGKLNYAGWFGCTETERLGCAKRIIENGWKMDY